MSLRSNLHSDELLLDFPIYSMHACKKCIKIFFYDFFLISFSFVAEELTSKLSKRFLCATYEEISKPRGWQTSVFKEREVKSWKKHTIFILFDPFPQLNSWWFVCLTGGPLCTRRHVFRFLWIVCNISSMRVDWRGESGSWFAYFWNSNMIFFP